MCLHHVGQSIRRITIRRVKTREQDNRARSTDPNQTKLIYRSLNMRCINSDNHGLKSKKATHIPPLQESSTGNSQSVVTAKQRESILARPNNIST